MGIASQRLRNHNGANWAYNWFARLPRDDYEIFTYSFEGLEDLDRAIARGRGEPFDPRGYQKTRDGFVAVATIEAEKTAGKMLARVDSAVRSKDAAVRQSFVTDTLALGPTGMRPVVAALQRVLEKEAEKLDRSGLKKQLDKVAQQRHELDAARAFAKELIFDEVKYFYPYSPPAVSSDRYAEYVRVQAEVDRRVAAVRTDVEFLIAGEDTEPGRPFETRLRRRAAELGLDPTLRFIGYQQDLPELLAAVDAVAVPSWNEAFGLIAAEAMAAGRAVIASNVGGLAELIEDGVTGLLVQPKDPESLAAAMLKLAESPALVEHVGLQARAGAHRFARGKGIEAVMQVYERIRPRR